MANRIYAEGAWEKATSKARAHKARVEELEAKAAKAKAEAEANKKKADLTPLKERKSVAATIVAVLAIVAACWASHALKKDSWLSRLLAAACGSGQTQIWAGPLRIEAGWKKAPNGPHRPWVKVSFKYPNRPVREGKKYKK